MSTDAATLRKPDIAADDVRRQRRRWIALVVLCLGQLMMVLDATIVNVALPSIQRDLHFTQSSLTWVINGYLITFGGVLLLAAGWAISWAVARCSSLASRCSRWHRSSAGPPPASRS